MRIGGRRSLWKKKKTRKKNRMGQAKMKALTENTSLDFGLLREFSHLLAPGCGSFIAWFSSFRHLPCFNLSFETFLPAFIRRLSVTRWLKAFGRYRWAICALVPTGKTRSYFTVVAEGFFFIFNTRLGSVKFFCLLELLNYYSAYAVCPNFQSKY